MLGIVILSMFPDNLGVEVCLDLLVDLDVDFVANLGIDFVGAVPDSRLDLKIGLIHELIPYWSEDTGHCYRRGEFLVVHRFSFGLGLGIPLDSRVAFLDKSPEEVQGEPGTWFEPLSD